MIGFLLFLLWLIGAVLVYGAMNAMAFDISNDCELPIEKRDKNIAADKEMILGLVFFMALSWLVFFIWIFIYDKTFLRFKNLR